MIDIIFHDDNPSIFNKNKNATKDNDLGWNNENNIKNTMSDINLKFILDFFSKNISPAGIG
jgi:hypothetical protein